MKRNNDSMPRKLTKPGFETFQGDVDAMFAQLQKYINGNRFFDDDTKSAMITLCMECNDKIIRIAEWEMHD